MRIHSNVLRERGLYDALTRVKSRGQVHRAVYLETVAVGSHQRLAAWEARLHYGGAKVPGDKRRPTNTGRYGAAGGWEPTQAAFCDEWGWWIKELLDIDPVAVVGPYKGFGEFHRLTRWQFIADEAAARDEAAEAAERELVEWWAGQRERVAKRCSA